MVARSLIVSPVIDPIDPARVIASGSEAIQPAVQLDRFGPKKVLSMTFGRGSYKLLLLVTIMLLAAGAGAQNTAADSTDKAWRLRHSPTKATIFSAVLPGAGQVYNRKYWKVPIVAAGIGTCIYFIDRNTRQYERYKDAYIALTDNDPNTVDEFNGQYSSGAILDVANTYRKWRDLSWICTGAVYILNIVDATVDAHFVRFDAGDDLTLAVAPGFELASQNALGVSLHLNF